MEKKKKILIVGDFSSIHLYNYSKNVLCDCHAEIWGFNIAGPIDSIRPHFLDAYKQLRINIQGGIKLNEGKFVYIKKTYQVLSSMGKFDICHLHFVSHYICPTIYLLRKNYTKISISFWGSDLYRANIIVRSLYRPLIKKSSSISFITKDMLSYFKKYFSKKSILKKCYILDFGNLFFKSIDIIKQSNDIQQYYDVLQLDCKKITITVGYCWRKEMRQYEALELILPVLNKNIVQIAIPAYGISEYEKLKLNDLLSSYDIKYIIYDYFMGEDEIPVLRRLTDIFIHPQTTDALSNAMIEHIYAGSVVLNGKWLNYQILDDNEVHYIKYKALTELPEVIQDTLRDLEMHKYLAEKNCSIVRTFTSWQYWASKWLELYK
ncbi:glycosyltransferase family protein [Macellibacteroides fermentans]|uniref:Glycosyltransferase n=1 Tax=Macellibacteroides fermentans TaxID=879969 RepID=A0A8E2D8Y3_9PORP|nr:glycosyltransferase [Macellibacteroides fermentans]NYI50814.1 hypothetical protein [Macellibacteroides fermentans]